MTDRELERRANRRLAVLRHVEEVSGNVAATCRYYGISRQCYYGWLRRFQRCCTLLLYSAGSRSYERRVEVSVSPRRPRLTLPLLVGPRTQSCMKTGSAHWPRAIRALFLQLTARRVK